RRAGCERSFLAPPQRGGGARALCWGCRRASFQLASFGKLEACPTGVRHRLRDKPYRKSPMSPDPRDTIVALSTAAGPGARAVVRLSGPAALDVAGAVVSTAVVPLPRAR